MTQINLHAYRNLYYKTRQQFVDGEITTGQWQEFCYQVLLEIMEENKDVLIRLKNRE